MQKSLRPVWFVSSSFFSWSMQVSNHVLAKTLDMSYTNPRRVRSSGPYSLSIDNKTSSLNGSSFPLCPIELARNSLGERPSPRPNRPEAEVGDGRREEGMLSQNDFVADRNRRKQRIPLRS